MKQKLIIGWLYPTLMNIYGDRGNIIVLQKRCLWREVEIEIKYLEAPLSQKEIENCDLLVMGGAQDRQQTIVAADLKKNKKILINLIENNIPGLYICGAYQFLGNYYKDADGREIEGLGILDLHTNNEGHERMIGNFVVNSPLLGNLIGFENHGGKTYLGKNTKPLAKVLNGFGNNGEDKTEGAIYKNTIGTYMHGPILPKNPELADFLIKAALEKKYSKKIKLTPLDNQLENKAREAIAKREGIEI